MTTERSEAVPPPITIAVDPAVKADSRMSDVKNTYGKLVMPQDGKEFNRVEDVPAVILQQWYMTLSHLMALVLVQAGGRIAIPRNLLEESDPRQLRVLLETNIVTQDWILTVVEDKE